MNVRQIVTDALRRYGEEVTITTAEGFCTAWAMITPLRRKHRLYLDEGRRDAGVYDASYRHYIGEADAPLSEGDEVIFRKERYAVVISERYDSCGEVIYIWAILKPKKERVDEYDNS